mmetsp:Transcript_31532/g.88457  ORF Transcript_31532/g.88457 Transcript_31532/m.88457 type:complete len:227 (-) Transcript_31532:143-823(-)
MPVVLDQVYLTGAIHRQNFRPDEHQHLPKVVGRGLQELQDIRKDPNGQGEVNGPRSQVEEARQQAEGAEPVGLAQQDLEDNGQLLGRTHTGGGGRLRRKLKPRFKRGELVGKERVLCQAVGDRASLGGDRGELRQAEVRGEVPRIPHGVLVRWGQLGVGNRGTLGRAHDPFRQEKITKEGRHEEVLAEEALEQRGGEDIPRDGVGDGGEDPVELAEHGAAIGETAG